MKKKTLVYGSMDFGTVARELVVHSGAHFAGFVDDWHSGPGIVGTLQEVLRKCAPDEYDFVIAIGYNHLEPRRRKFEELRALGYDLPAFIHPRAYVSDSSKVGKGSLIMAHATLDVRSQVGDMVVVWPGAVINHDSVIEGNTFISPNATVCGFCHIELDTFVGAGAVIVDHTRVEKGAFIKAGTVFHRRAHD